MTSELLKLTAYEAKNELVLSLEQAFEELKPELRPPFPLTIPSPQEFSRLNLAILYGVLTEPHLAKTHIKHLHAIVTDGYALFGSLILKIVNDLYGKLVDSVKDQLVWVVKEMVDVLGVGFDGFLVCLLRQIVGGDFSDGNLWLCFELVSLFSSKWDSLLENAPFVLTSALYVYLRVLADHCKVSTDAKLESLKRLEIEFCVKMLREQFNLCMKIGRDLIRLLRDLVHVPEFQAIWKDMVLNPSEFRTEGFSDISQLYCSRTSSRYFLLRITPEMEAHLRFLLMHVKFGNQKRYQMWFAKKFLFGQERETIVADIIRFICCAHHPSNETIQSDIIPRWAVIGWLLKSCRKKYVESNTKLALFYDWLFFDEKIDNIMNIEPAMLLMVCSIPKYVDITHSLLEFLLFIAENYEVDRNYVIIRGLSSAMRVLVQKGVVRSMDILTSCDALSPLLREGLRKLILRLNMESNELQPAHLPPHSVSHSSLQNVSHLAKSTPAPERQSAKIMEVGISKEPADSSIPISGDSFTTSYPSNVASESQFDDIESLVQNLADAMKKSNRMGLQILEEILLSFVNLDGQASWGSTFPETLSSKIVDQFESVGYQLFAPFDVSISVPYSDSGIHSPTVLIARSFILSQHERLQEMLLFWSRNGYQVGAHLLFYAARLAYEACISDSSGNAISSSNSSKISDSGMSLFLFHVDGYFSIRNGRKQDFLEGSAFTSKMDKEFVDKLVKNAFVAYKCFLERSRTILHKEDDLALSNQFVLDITSCFLCERKKTKFFYSIFSHLADLCAGNTDIIRFLVSQLDHADLLEMQFEIGLKGLSVFGESTEDIFHLMKNSVSWDPSEQHKLWGLIRSELSVSKVQLEKIILKIFCSNELDANTSAIAVGGLLTLCSCRAPTPELVGAIMLLPNDVFQDFAPTVLTSWVVSNASMLFDSLTKFSEKFDNENGNAAGSVGIVINHSAILWLLNYFKSHGMNDSNILSTFSASISCEKPA